jgi:hypothetical protein
MPPMKILLHAVLAATLCFALSSCEMLRSLEKPKYQFSVHVQGSTTDMPRDIIQFPYQGQQLIFKKVPEFSQRAIAAFQAFPAEDGVGNGLVLKLDAHGRNQLETITRTHQGELLLTIVNGVPVDIIQIDQPIADGKFVIWRGVSDETVAEMETRLAHISAIGSSSKHLDMLPTTDKEKKDARKAEIEEKKYLEEMARRAERGEDITKPPRTKEIPLE